MPRGHQNGQTVPGRTEKHHADTKTAKRCPSKLKYMNN